MWNDTVNTNCCLNSSLARLVDSAHYKQQTTSLQITRVHQKVCFFFPNFCFCQSNLVQKITKINTNILKYSNSLDACLEINNQRKSYFRPKRRMCLEVSCTKVARRRGPPTLKENMKNFPLGKKVQQSAEPKKTNHALKLS